MGVIALCNKLITLKSIIKTILILFLFHLNYFKFSLGYRWEINLLGIAKNLETDTHISSFILITLDLNPGLSVRNQFTRYRKKFGINTSEKEKTPNVAKLRL